MMNAGTLSGNSGKALSELEYREGNDRYRERKRAREKERGKRKASSQHQTGGGPAHRKLSS